MIPGNKGKETIDWSTKGIRFLFLSILFLAPLNYGSFFEEKFLLLAIAIAALFLFSFQKSSPRICFTVPDVFLLLLALVYFISFWGAAAPHQAFVGFLKYVFYFAVFFLVRYLGDGRREGQRIVLQTMMASLTLGTIVTFLAQANILEPYKFLYEQRFCSTFQYPNVYAIMLVAVICFTIYFAVDSTKRWPKALYLAVWYLNTVAFWATMSRGALLVYLPVLLILIFCLERGKRLWTAGNILFINVLGLGSTSFILQNNDWRIFPILLAGIVLCLFFNWVVRQKLTRSPLFIIAVVILVFLSAGQFAAHFPQEILTAKLKRLTEIKLTAKTVGFRFFLYENAWQIFRNNWLLGVGADGWNVLYRQVQGHLYDSSYVHSSILQTAVESGVIGLSLFLGLWFTIFREQIKNWRSHSQTVIEKIIFLVVCALFLHSLVDLIFSFTAVSLYLFVLVGLLGRGKCFFPKCKPILSFCAIISALVLFLSSSSMGLAHYFSHGALVDLRVNQVTGMIARLPQFEQNLKIAQKLAPLNPLYASHLGLIKIAKGFAQNSSAEIEKGLWYLEKAIEMSPSQYETYVTKGLALGQLKRYEEAIPYFERVIALMPMQHSGYQYAIENLVQLAIDSGQKRYLEQARHIYQRTIVQMHRVAPAHLPYWEGEKLNEAVFLNYYRGIAECLLGEYERADIYFSLALKGDVTIYTQEIAGWLAVNREQKGLAPLMTADSVYVRFARDHLEKYQQKAGQLDTTGNSQ